MPMIEMPEEVHRTPQAAGAAETHAKGEAALHVFMAKASQAAVDMSPVVTREIETRGLDSGQALIAVLLYAANFARRAGASLTDFMGSAEQAFTDSEELFATSAVDVLRKARQLIVRGWCQGELALKWIKDASLQDGKRLTNCHVDDKYTSRWSLLGAIEACADAASNRSKARSALVLAIRDAGFQFEPGSLDITVINEYNDIGWAPPLPKLVLPKAPPDGAPAEAMANWQVTVTKMKKNYEEITVPQWPKPAVPGRTQVEVLAVIDRAITISGG